PPSRRTPPILFSRPTHEWLSRVDQRQKQLAALAFTGEQKERFTRRNEIEFVYSTLRLEGLTVAREQVAALVSSSPEKASESDHDARAILEVIQSLRTIEALIQSRGRHRMRVPLVLGGVVRRTSSGRAIFYSVTAAG